MLYCSIKWPLNNTLLFVITHFLFCLLFYCHYILRSESLWPFRDRFVYGWCICIQTGTWTKSESENMLYYQCLHVALSVQGVMCSRRGYCWTAKSQCKGWNVCVMRSTIWYQFEPGFRQEVQITSACFESLTQTQNGMMFLSFYS